MTLPTLSTIGLAAVLLSTAGAQTRKSAATPNDWQIETQVQQVLGSDHSFKGSSILSSVNKGVVLLTGSVRSEAERTLASTELGQINGVKTVLNNLVIADNSVHATPAPAAPLGRTGPKTVTLADGTPLAVRLNDEIDTKTAKAGDTFHATTAVNVTLAGTPWIGIPSGTAVTGRIVDAKAAGRLSGAAELSVELLSINLSSPTGARDVAVLTDPLSSKGNGRGGNTAAKAGGGAALGAVVGALAGGGAGAGIGAASGGALGLGANALTHGKEIDLMPEHLLHFKTSAPLDVTIMLNNGTQVLETGRGRGLGVHAD